VPCNGPIDVMLQTLFRLLKSESGQLTWINAPTSFLSYCHHMKAARVLTLAERALVAEWIACAGDIGEAYVSARRDHDPAIRNRVVIVTRPEDGPTHVFHAQGAVFFMAPVTAVRLAVGRRSRTVDGVRRKHVALKTGQLQFAQVWD
jgi:hypothetical protein